MKEIKEIFSNNWNGDGIFPEWWEFPFYHKLWIAPFLVIQTPVAIAAFVFREFKREKIAYFKNKNRG